MLAAGRRLRDFFEGPHIIRAKRPRSGQHRATGPRGRGGADIAIIRPIINEPLDRVDAAQALLIAPDLHANR